MKKIKTLFISLIMASVALCQTPAIQVEKTGVGNPIIFLPGFTTPGSIWKETIDALESESENHMVSYAGFNGLAPIEMPWYATIKKELITYIEKEDLQKVSIIGHSMGGNLAIDLAAAIPDRIEKLILVDAIPCMREIMMPGVPASQIQYENPYNKRMLEMPDSSFYMMAKGMAFNMTNNSAKIEMLTNWILEADRKTYVYGYTDLLQLDLRNVLDKVKAETLILGASFPDPSLVAENYKNQYEKLTNKHIEISDNSKHFIMFDQPEWFYKKVNIFLSK